MKDFARYFTFALLLPFGLKPLFGQSQQQEGFSFMNVVNLLPVAEAAKITLMGKDVMPNGLKPGEHSGWFIVPHGTHTLSIAAEGLKSASGQVECAIDANRLVVVFALPDRRESSDGKPRPPIIRTRTFDAFHTAKGHGLRLASLLTVERPFRLLNQTISLKPLDFTEVKGWRGQGFEITQGASSYGKVEGDQEAGSYYLLLMQEPTGAGRSVLVRSNPHHSKDYQQELRRGNKRQAQRQEPHASEHSETSSPSTNQQ